MHLPSTDFHPAQLCLATSSRNQDDPQEAEDRGPQRGRSLRVLIVEDEFFISLHTKDMLEAMGHVVVAIAVSADDAETMAERHEPDVVLMDIRLIGKRDGIDAAAEIRRRFDIPSIFITANSDPAIRRRAAAVRPLGFIEKPLTEHRLQEGLRQV